MTIIEFTTYLGYLAPALLFLAFVKGLMSYRQIDNTGRALMWYVLMLFLVDIASRTFGVLFGNNHILLLVYSLLELLLVGYFYLNALLYRQYRFMQVMVILGVLYIIYEIFTTLYVQTNISQFQPYSKVVTDFIIILLTLTLFYENINKKQGGEYRIFNLNIAFLIYFTINLIVFLPFNFLVNENTGLKFYIWFINIMANIVLYAYMVLFIWKDKPIAAKKIQDNNY